MISQRYLLSHDKSKLYLLFNDLVPNKRKLLHYNIGRIDSEICEVCGEIDTNLHRIRTCVAGKEIREWVFEIFRKRYRISAKQIDDLFFWRIDNENFPQKAAMWLAVHFVAYCVDKFPCLNLFTFQRSIREFRWNSKVLVRKYFEDYLNIC